MNEVFVPLGEALEHCLKDSARAWLRENRVGRSSEEAWATDVTTTYLTAELNHGGRISVQVSITARDHWKSSIDYFKLQRDGKLGYVRLGHTLTPNRR